MNMGKPNKIPGDAHNCPPGAVVWLEFDQESQVICDEARIGGDFVHVTFYEYLNGISC